MFWSHSYPFITFRKPSISATLKICLSNVLLSWFSLTLQLQPLINFLWDLCVPTNWLQLMTCFQDSMSSHWDVYNAVLTKLHVKPFIIYKDR